MRLFRRGVTCACVLVGFLALAALQAWPLPLHLGTRLTGPPGGDTGVYVWNTWVFRHELVDLGRQPYATDAIFWSGQPANLSLHNYTPFADVLALFLQPFAGVVATFNLVYLINAALAGVAMYLLARRFTPDRAVAWLAGALFMISPFLVARGAGHFSLAAAAPLPLFVWQLMRTYDRPTAARAAMTGLIAAWAGLSDPYYLIYCAMLGGIIAAARIWRLDTAPAAAQRRVSRWDLALAAATAVVGILAVRRVERFAIGPVTVSMTTLYTPVLVLTMLAMARVIVRLRPRLSLRRWPSAAEWRAGAVAAGAALVPLAPWAVALIDRVRVGTMVSAPVLWRSSTQGVDLLGLLVPNPNHPWMPDAVRATIAAWPGGFIEQVASLPLVALLIVWLAWRRGVRAPRLWVAIAAGFALLSLGPFVHVAGVNTYIPTPWTLLRYVPIIGDARAPSRFAVVTTMACAILFAQALGNWRARTPSPRGRRLLLAGAAVLMAVELVPAPRTLYSARIPSIYAIVAADTRPVGLLELPFGLRDGLSSSGNFTAATQFFQTFHHKPVFGGYLSRISEARKLRYRNRDVLGALMALSEGRELTPGQYARARQGAAAFLSTASLGYVVIDQARSSATLRAFALELLGLRKVGESAGRELFVPGQKIRGD